MRLQWDLFPIIGMCYPTTGKAQHFLSLIGTKNVDIHAIFMRVRMTEVEVGEDGINRVADNVNLAIKLSPVIRVVDVFFTDLIGGLRHR